MKSTLYKKATNINKSPGLWGNRNFLLLWGGSIISGFGLQIYTIAIPLLIYDMTQSALAMSMMRAVDFLPNIFIGIIAGVLVDRFNRKRMMQWMSITQIISLTFIVFLLYVHTLELWHLYLFGFILSSAGYTFGNAQHSVIPQIVTKEQLTDANAKIQFINTLISMVGPGLAGTLLLYMDYSSTLFIFLICLFLLFLCVQFLKFPTATLPREAQGTFKEDIKEGINVLFANKYLLTPTIVVIFINFASSLVIGVLIFYVTDQLGATSDEIGWMFTISAIGGLCGASVAKYLRNYFGRGQIYTYSLLINTLGMVILIFANTWWMIGISLAIRTFATITLNIVYFTVRQEFTPNHLLGRVAGTSSMLMKLALPAGLIISGLWAEWFSIKFLFIFSTVILFFLFIILLRHPFRKLQ
ncbi:MFS transporter [Oceanobacillus sp. 1P07AA]|uniref:MFS transporter n=1 Tax=Oceanobacillus sp. 1P07AA TaxID=3132293 RepID=UPI0039A41093